MGPRELAKEAAYRSSSGSRVALLVGGLSVWAAMYLITLEGTGAGFLASLPISERELAELKTRLTVLIGSPASFGFYLVAGPLVTPRSAWRRLWPIWPPSTLPLGSLA